MCRCAIVCLAVLLSGCAVNQASFSIRDPELFKSPKGHHIIQLDKTLYYFEYKLDERLNHWVPPSDNSPPLFDLKRDEFRSSVPSVDNDTADRQTVIKRRVPGEDFCPGREHLRLLPEACR